MWQVIEQKWKQIVVITPLVAGGMILANYFGIFRSLEWASLDQFFRLRQEEIDDRIVIVTIDEPDIQHVKQWPMSDRVMAQMINNIKAQNPRAIGIDIYRDLPVEPGHEELVQVFETTPNFVGIEKIAGNPIAPPPILAELGQISANDLLNDADGKIRRGVVLLGKSDGAMITGLGVELALRYLEEEGVELSIIDESQQIYGLGQAVFQPLTGAEGEYTPKDMGGYQILLNYRGNLDRFPNISMTDVLENLIPEGLMDDRIVFIGSKAPSLNDNYPTPYNSALTPTDLVPGVVIHANLTSQVLSAALEGRPMLHATTHRLNWALILLWAGYSTTLGSLFTQKRWLTIGGLALGLVLVPGISFLAFQSGWLVPLFTPVATIVVAAVISIGATLWGDLKEYARTLEDKVKERTAELAAANADLAGANVEISKLNEMLKAENLRMSAELDIVREMQQLILPKPEEFEEIEDLEIAGYMDPADEVGGDYYDVLYHNGVVTFGIGDVTGHGLESGILMIMTQTAVRTLQEMREDDPVRFLDTLNRTIYKNIQRMNTEKNLTLAILNYAHNTVSISGQHEETIVVRADGTVELVDTMDLGFPIGLDDEISDFIDHTTIELQPGDGIVLYTDGITEAKNMDKEQYELERLCDVISKNWQRSAEEIKQAVVDDVRRHIGEQKVFDDITLLVLKQK